MDNNEPLVDRMARRLSRKALLTGGIGALAALFAGRRGADAYTCYNDTWTYRVSHCRRRNQYVRCCDFGNGYTCQTTGWGPIYYVQSDYCLQCKYQYGEQYC